MRRYTMGLPDVKAPKDIKGSVNENYVDPGKLKVTLRMNDGSDESWHMCVKLTIPKKWKPGPVSKLLHFAVDTWNAKHAQLPPLTSESWHLQVNNQPLGTDDIIRDVLRPSDVVLLKPGKAPSHGKVAKRSYANVQQMEEALKHTPSARHNAHQKECYDAASTLYSRPQCELRPDVAETLDRLAERIVERAAQNRAEDGFALRIFDAGCGAGHLTKKIAALSTEKRKVEVIAVDLSPRTIEYCNQNKPANVKYECGDVGDYPHPSRIGEGVTFDVVVFHACLQHVFSPLKALQAASRLLRGGGAVIIAQAQGRNHADELRVKDPVLQPRGLPASPEDVEELIPEQCPLELASFKDEVPYVVELKCTKKFEEAIGFKDMMADEDPLGSFLRKKTGKEPSGPEKLRDNAEGVVFGPARPPKPPAE